MDRADVVIVGAGPAGLMCAWRCASSGLSVLVLEKNQNPGRKLLASGSGKCNLSSAKDLSDYLTSYGDKGRFVKPSLLNFPSASLCSFFEERGLPVRELHDGKLFPETERASDVLNILVKACKETGVTINTGCSVQQARLADGSERLFELSVTTYAALGSFMVIACGGASYPKTGSAGDGYSLASGFGHKIINPRPSLAPVYPIKYDCISCAGIALEHIEVSWRRSGKKIGQRQGDVLFTHEGLSGPGILDASRDFQSGDELLLCLVRGETRESLTKRILELCAANPKKTLKNLLSPLGLPEALVLVVLRRCGAEQGETTGSALSKETRRTLVENLIEFRFVVGRIGDFNEAMATAGGVDTREVGQRTMESSLVSGLFFAGEVLDVDGDTGGFNLQFAFSSGILAAETIIRRTSRDR